MNIDEMTANERERLGLALKAWRIVHEKTLTGIAKDLDVSKSTYHLMERGHGSQDNYDAALAYIQKNHDELLLWYERFEELRAS